MGLIEKILAFVMIPLSILIFLEQINVFSISFFIDKILIGAILMILLQLLTIIQQKITNGHFGLVTIVTSVIFIMPAGLYLTHLVVSVYIPLILAVFMLAEALYALH